MHRRITGQARDRDPQSRQAGRDARTAGAARRRGGVGRRAWPWRARRDRQRLFAPMQRSRPSRRRRRRSFRPSPTIPDWWSTRSTARPESSRARWAGPSKDFAAAMTRIERLLQERGATTPAQRTRAFRFRTVRRLARRSSRRGRGARRRHAGMAAARHRRLRLRSDVHARRTHAHLRRNDQPRETRPAAAGARACRIAPVPSSSWRRSALTRADAASPRVGEKEAFGVYVHWPFCLSKCPYCDFNSHVRHAAIDEDRFAAPSRARSKRPPRARRAARSRRFSSAAARRR